MRYILIGVGTALWFAPFVLFWRGQRNPVRVNRKARWGMLLELVAYSLLWLGRFWELAPGAWQVAGSAALFALACLISWTATRALGKEFRVDAAVGADHELIRSGPYRIVRHPIYTSILCVMLATALLISGPLLTAISIAVFLTGTLIRMRAEDSLLEEHFGARFREYKGSVAGLIPFVW